jgi:septum site-determining protein MinD
MTRIIGVVSGKGGVGKTTLVANMGAMLAGRFGKRIIAVDCNVSTSHLGLYLGMYYYPVSLNQVLSGEASIEEAIYNYSVPGMQIIPASLSRDELRGVDVSLLKNAIKGLFGKADLILLDAAPGLGREAMAAMRASDEVVFVTTPFVPPVVDVIKCNQAARDVGAKPLGVALNMTGEGRHELTPQEVEQLVELPVIASIPRDKAVLRSLSARVPLMDLSPRSAATREIARLAAFVLGEDYREAGALSRLAGIFRRRSQAEKVLSARA